MPSLSRNKITFDETDFLQGLHPQYFTSATDTPAVKITNRLSAATAFNPYRHLGYASPGFNPTDVTNVSVVTGNPIRSMVVGVESGTYYGYGISGGNKLFQIGTTDGALTNDVGAGGVWPHTIIATTAEEGQDVIVYDAKVSGTSQKCLFYSYNDNGSDVWDIGRYLMDGTTFDDDFMSTVPASPLSPSDDTNPHPMIIGNDDVIYIGDGNKVHAYDGQEGNEGTFYDSVLTIPNGYRITSFASYDVEVGLVIFAYWEGNNSASAGLSTFNDSKAKAYFWDYLNLDPYRVVSLGDNAVTCGFEYKGTVGCFTQGRQGVFDGSNRFSKMALYDGLVFEPVTKFIGNAPIHGGVDVNGDTIMWNSQGIIHQYGSPHEGMPIGLNKIAAGSGTTSGAIKSLTSLLQVISTGTTTSGGLQKITNNYAASATVATAIAEPVFEEGKIGRVRSVTVYFGKTSSGGRAMSLYIQGNDTTADQIISGVEDVVAGNLVQRFTSDINGGTLPKFQDLKCILTWSGGSGATDAPIVKRVDVEYESINIENT